MLDKVINRLNTLRNETISKPRSVEFLTMGGTYTSGLYHGLNVAIREVKALKIEIEGEKKDE